MEIKGIIKQVGKTQVLSDKFSKRELILKTDYESKYPQYIVVQFTNANITKLDSVQPGEVVTVSINLRGREYTDQAGTLKYFNTIEGWHIKKDEGVVTNQNPSLKDTDILGDKLPF